MHLKDISKIDDQTLVLADMSTKAISQIREAATALLMANGMDPAVAHKVARALSDGRWTHDYPITAEMAKNFGLPVSTDMPEEVRAIIRLYPQPRGRRPSVEYVPEPYRRQPTRTEGGEYT